MLEILKRPAVVFAVAGAVGTFMLTPSTAEANRFDVSGVDVKNESDPKTKDPEAPPSRDEPSRPEPSRQNSDRDDDDDDNSKLNECGVQVAIATLHGQRIGVLKATADGVNPKVDTVIGVQQRGFQAGKGYSATNDGLVDLSPLIGDREQENVATVMADFEGKTTFLECALREGRVFVNEKTRGGEVELFIIQRGSNANQILRPTR
jgi:hypothetical protein